MITNLAAKRFPPGCPKAYAPRCRCPTSCVAEDARACESFPGSEWSATVSELVLALTVAEGVFWSRDEKRVPGQRHCLHHQRDVARPAVDHLRLRALLPGAPELLRLFEHERVAVGAFYDSCRLSLPALVWPAVRKSMRGFRPLRIRAKPLRLAPRTSTVPSRASVLTHAAMVSGLSSGLRLGELLKWTAMGASASAAPLVVFAAAYR